MNKRILHKQDSGIIGIICPFEGFLYFFVEKLQNESVEFLILDKSNINIDNEYFNAYEFDAELGAKVNIEKAKAIHLDKFRATRNPLLVTLDADFMRAVESGNTTLQQEIASKKQALRDVTKAELPNTLEEIKATWPEIFGPKPF